MSRWPSTKARKVLAALLGIGWSIKRHAAGSHRVLERAGWPDVVFAFHDNAEIGPRMLARIASKTGLQPTYELSARRLGEGFSRRRVRVILLLNQKRLRRICSPFGRF